MLVSLIAGLFGKINELLVLCNAATVCFFLFLVMSSFAFLAAKDSAWSKVPQAFMKEIHLKMTPIESFFHMDSLTSAHKYFAFDTWVKVTG